MFKEIVTKAIIGKGKKTTKEEHQVMTNENVDNVLGCWVINHTFSGIINGDDIIVNGNYDVNIWYSYNNNTKTNVLIERYTYNDKMNVRIKENSKLTSNSEIIVRSLNQPSVTDVSLDNGVITLTVEKQMGVEVVGDTKVRVMLADDIDDYEEIIDEEEIEVNEDYLD